MQELPAYLHQIGLRMTKLFLMIDMSIQLQLQVLGFKKLGVNLPCSPLNSFHRLSVFLFHFSLAKPKPLLH